MTPMTTLPLTPKLGERLAVLATAAALVLVLSASASALTVSCPDTIDETAFASAAELRELNAKIASFGLRNPGSIEHNRMLDWLEREFRAIPGMKLRSDYYTLTRWQPLARATGSRTLPRQLGEPASDDGGRRPLSRAVNTQRDLAEAGGLTVDGFGAIPVSGAIPFTVPTSTSGTRGELVYIPNDVPDHGGQCARQDRRPRGAARHHRVRAVPRDLALRDPRLPGKRKL